MASQTISLCYHLAGECAVLDLPAVAGHPERRNFLWKETCFELFVNETDAEGYWEINLSPAGHWNIYRFDGYRKGMREEMEMAAPAVHVDDKNPGVWKISTDIHLAGIMPDEIISARQPFRVAASAVIKTASDHISYWALTHPGPEPDFHHRDSFAIRLE